MRRPRARALAETEDDFQAAVIQLAELLGWMLYHVTNVRGRLRSHTSSGFPDLVLVRGLRCLFIELKTDSESPSPEQDRWLSALLAVPGLEVDVWRPRDWPHIERTLGVAAALSGKGANRSLPR